MNIKKLFEILALVEDVSSSRWNDVMLLVAGIKDGSVEVKEKKWNDEYKQNNLQYYPLDLSNILTWSTFEGECISLKFLVEDGKLLCYVKIYDGDSFNGYRKNLRFTATLLLPDSFIEKIEDKINWEFNDFAETEYEKHLMIQRKQWIENFKSKFIG